MKTYNTDQKSMLDMIFENKNKAYGAYAIRSAYNDTVIKALLVVSGLLLTLICSAALYNKFNTEPILEQVNEGVEQLTTTLVDMEPIEKEQPKNEPENSPKKAMTALPTSINDHAVEPPATTREIGPITTDGDTTNRDPGPITIGTGTTTVVSEPVVVQTPPTIHTVVEQMPEYPGGIEALQRYLQNNTKYPQMELEAGIGGKVFVKFVVNADGSIGTAEILKGVNGGDGLTKEALRVVRSMPKWKPGKQNNVAVPVYFNLPINFQPK